MSPIHLQKSRRCIEDSDRRGYDALLLEAVRREVVGRFNCSLLFFMAPANSSGGVGGGVDLCKGETTWKAHQEVVGASPLGKAGIKSFRNVWWVRIYVAGPAI